MAGEAISSGRPDPPPARVSDKAGWRIRPVTSWPMSRGRLRARNLSAAALNRALEGVDGQTAVHICFGYAAIIHERPEGYSFLPEFHDCRCNQVSIETAQSGLDCKVLETLPEKTIILGVIDLELTRRGLEEIFTHLTGAELRE